MSLNRTEIEGLLPFLANDTLAGEERVLGIGQAVLPSAPDAVTGDLAAIETGEEAGGMRLASGGDAAAQMAVFRAGFAAETTEAELRALLLAADLQIVAGPSALGFYELAPGSAATDLDAAEAALTAAGTLEVLERIAPEGQ